jgi:hypothetical protein
MGIARPPRDGDSVQSIEKAADRVMYDSKRMVPTTVIAGDPKNRAIFLLGHFRHSAAHMRSLRPIASAA